MQIKSDGTKSSGDISFLQSTFKYFLLIFEVIIAILWADGSLLAGTILQTYLWSVLGLYSLVIIVTMVAMNRLKTFPKPEKLSAIGVLTSLGIQGIRIWFLFFMGLYWLPLAFSVAFFMGFLYKEFCDYGYNNHGKKDA